MAGKIEQDCISIPDVLVRAEGGQLVNDSGAGRRAFGEHDDLFAGDGELCLEVFLEVKRIGDSAAEGGKAG